MKKYFITAVAALSLGGLMTSCTKDKDFSGGTTQSSQDIQKTYEEAFLSTFGRPVEGINWGFGPETTASTRAMTRAPQSATVDDWVFASAPTNDDFEYTKSSIPSDALLPSGYGDSTKGSVHNYKLEETTNTQNVSFYAGNYNLYIEGTKSINYTNPGDGSKNMKIYVMPGANVTFTQNFTQKAAGELTIYIPATATVNFNGGLQAYLTLYNRGIVNVKGGYKPGIYDGGIFYNEGTFNIDGANDYYFDGKNCSNPLTLNNGDSQFINAGNLNIGALTLEGSSHFLNLGTTTVSGLTIVNSNQCTWVNEGQYTTGDFIYHAGSTDVRNNCKMTVTNMFHINLGDTDKNNFTNNAGASVVAENFEFQGPGYIKMGANSLFKVNKTATMNITKPDYGFWGPTSGTDYAVLQAKDIVSGTNNSKYVTYGGNLYVYSETHFAQGWSGQYPYYYLGDKAKIYAEGDEFLDGLPSITISPSTCNPGFTGDPTSEPDPVIPEPEIPIDTDPEAVMVVAEDLSTFVNSEGKDMADFDFNDVVFEVRKGASAINIKLRAAGGTLPLTIGGTAGETVDNHGEQVLAYEVHRLFKVSTGTMVNTNATSSGASREDVEFSIPYPEGVSAASNIYEVANAIPIRVYREDVSTNEKGWIEIQKAQPVTSSSGNTITASKLCVDTNYEWCNERTHIDQKFPYIDSYGNNKGSRFRMYLSGTLRGKWWQSAQ